MSALAQLSKFIDRFNTIIGYLCAFFVFSMVIVVSVSYTHLRAHET